MFTTIFRKNEAIQDESSSSSWIPRSQFPSMGLKVVAEFLSSDFDQNHVILDLAEAKQSVVDYIGKFNCIYLVCNAIESLTQSSQEDNSNIRDYSQIFRRVLPRQSSPGISAIFVWDLFNYLHRREIISLMAYLSPYCREGTRLFTISWLTETIPRLPGNFELTANGEIIYELASNEVILSPEYSAQALVDMMPSFIPSRLSVTRSGMLEVVLEFNELVAAPNPDIIPSGRLSAFSRN